MTIHYIHPTLGTEKELDVALTEGSYRYRSLMGEHVVYLYFALSEFVDIPTGAWIEYQGVRYELMTAAEFVKNNTQYFEYTLIMQSAQERLKRYVFRRIFLDSYGNPSEYSPRIKFSYTAKPIDHLKMLVNNLNYRELEEGWSVGNCIDAVEKTITYNAANCFEALAQIAEEFETEWEIIDTVIHLGKVEYSKDTPLGLSYGKGNGLKPGLGRVNYSDSLPIERLFVQGGTQNIDVHQYGEETLMLPPYYQLGYDGERFSDEDGYDSNKGRMYRAKDMQTITRYPDTVKTGVEGCLDCSHIFPQRVGTVTAVEKMVDGWNFWDSTIPDNLDYSEPDIRIAGEQAVVTFQSGRLAGREFEIVQTKTRITGYIHNDEEHLNDPDKKRGRFKLISDTIDGQEMPSDTFKPEVGDRYVVFNICMPQAYISDNNSHSGASWDMYREAIKYLYENEYPKFTFTGELDGNWARAKWAEVGGKIKPGGYVLYSDTQFITEGTLVRITGVKEYLHRPYSPEIDLSNAPVRGNLKTTIDKIDQNETKTEEDTRQVVQYTKRNFRQVQETVGMLEGNLENFTESINPTSMNAMLAYLGDTTLQYRFINNRTDKEEISAPVSYDNVNKILTVEASIIQHMTLPNTTDIRPKSADNYWFWNMATFTSGVLDDNKAYYLYAKVIMPPPNSATITFSYIVSDIYVNPYQGSNLYLLVGVLNMPFEGERSFVPLYGFSEWSPQQLIVNRVVSADGYSYFDLVNKAFKLANAGYSRGIDWNETAVNQLTIKGLINAVGAILGGFTIDNNKFVSNQATNGTPNIQLEGTNGSGHLAAGNISWDAAGKVLLKGGQSNLKIPFLQIGINGTYNIMPDENPNLSLYVPTNSIAYAILPIDKDDKKYVGAQCLIVNIQIDSGDVYVKQQNNLAFFQNDQQVIVIKRGEAVRFTNIGAINSANNYGEWLYEYLIATPVTRG